MEGRLFFCLFVFCPPPHPTLFSFFFFFTCLRIFVLTYYFMSKQISLSSVILGFCACEEKLTKVIHMNIVIIGWYRKLALLLYKRMSVCPSLWSWGRPCRKLSTVFSVCSQALSERYHCRERHTQVEEGRKSGRERIFLTQFHSVGQDQSTVIQRAETTVAECSPTPGDGIACC